MRWWLVFLLLMVGVAHAQVPAPAAAVGYNTLTYGPQVTVGANPTTVPLSAGSTWQPFAFFGNSWQNLSSVITQNADGSVTLGTNIPNGFGNMLSTAAPINNASQTYIQGTAFGGGFYAEVTMSFALNVTTGGPAFWANDVESMAGGSEGDVSLRHWAGQVRNYGDWIENDITEFDSQAGGGCSLTTNPCLHFSLHNFFGPGGEFNGETFQVNDQTVNAGNLYSQTVSPTCVTGTNTPPTGTGTGIVDGTCRWSFVSSFSGEVSTSGSGSPAQQPNGTDFTQKHKYAALWVPATATTQGFVKYYFDGVQIGNTCTWNQYNSATAPPPVDSSSPCGGSSAYSVMDTRHMALILGNAVSVSSQNPGAVTIYSVNVWQKDASQDLGPTNSTTTASGAPLSSGYFNVVGNQIQDGSGNNQRIAATTYRGAPTNLAMMQAIRNAGFNAVKLDWRDAGLSNTNPSGSCGTLTEMDQCVTNAQTAGLKVILSHRGNEIPATTSVACNSRQSNGLWFDLGGSSGGDDGCGDGGNFTYTEFKTDTVNLLQHYNGNSTVIAYEMHHEPVVIGNATGIAGSNLVFNDQLTSFWLHRAWQSPDIWGPIATTTQDGRGGPNFGEFGDQWWTNPLNPNTAVTGLYTQSGSILNMNLLNLPASMQTYVNTQSGATNLKYAGMLINNQNADDSKYGVYKVKVAVDKVPGLTWQMDAEDFPPTFTSELDIVIYTDANNVQHAVFEANGSSITSPFPTFELHSPSFDPSVAHEYSWDWEPGGVTYFVDGVQKFQFTPPSDGTWANPMFLYVLTAANYGPLAQMGTACASLQFTSGNCIDPNPASLPAGAHVDYITHTGVGGSATGAGQFVASKGQVTDPNGTAWVGRGFNVTTEDVQAGNVPLATLQKLFPRVNYVRVSNFLGGGYTDGDDPTNSTISAWTKTLTDAGIRVEFSDYAGNSPACRTGSDLINASNWYKKISTFYTGNPFVGYESQNECFDGGSGPFTWAPQVTSNYNAVRGGWFQGIVIPSAGYVVTNSGNTYTSQGACTASSSGNGPTSTGNGITDGSCVWNFAATNPTPSGGAPKSLFVIGSPGGNATPAGQYLNSQLPLSGMTNIVWDLHPYAGAYTGVGTAATQAAYDAALASWISSWKGFTTNSEGAIPVFSGEFGNSTDGTNVDATGQLATVSGADNLSTSNGGSAVGYWLWFCSCNPAGVGDQITTGGSNPSINTVNAYGPSVQTAIANAPGAGPTPLNGGGGGPLPNNPAITWGGGGDTDIRNACSDVGTAVFAVNPNVIEFCPGPLNNATALLNTGAKP